MNTRNLPISVNRYTLIRINNELYSCNYHDMKFVRLTNNYCSSLDRLFLDLMICNFIIIKNGNGVITKGMKHNVNSYESKEEKEKEATD